MSATGRLAIEAHGLTRKFGSFTAVDGIDLSVPRGTIFGLLGANGAGKSTTIRMLCGLLRSSAGSARVGGYDIDRRPEQIKRSIGYMSQEFSLYRDLTVAENIRFFGGAYGLSQERIRSRSDWVVRMAGLEAHRTALAAELSGGFRQRLALGCALLHEPQILFLDEPTGGVDPLSRREFWDLINGLAEQGVTILVTTHYLDEAEYCNSVSLMHAGRIAAEGPPSELKRTAISHTMWELRCSDPAAAAGALGALPWVVDVSSFGRSVHVGTRFSGERTPEALTEALREHGIETQSVSPLLPSLEDVFIHVIQQQLAREAAR